MTNTDNRGFSRFIYPRKHRLTKPVLLLIIIITLFGSYHIALKRVRVSMRSFNRGTALLSEGRFEESLDQFNKSIKAYPRIKLAWTGKAICLLNLGRYEEAIASYNRVLRRDNDNYASLMGKALSYEKLNMINEAIQCYDNALEYFPKNPQFTARREILLK